MLFPFTSFTSFFFLFYSLLSSLVFLSCLVFLSFLTLISHFPSFLLTSLFLSYPIPLLSFASSSFSLLFSPLISCLFISYSFPVLSVSPLPLSYSPLLPSSSLSFTPLPKLYPISYLSQHLPFSLSCISLHLISPSLTHTLFWLGTLSLITFLAVHTLPYRLSSSPSLWATRDAAWPRVGVESSEGERERESCLMPLGTPSYSASSWALKLWSCLEGSCVCVYVCVFFLSC